MILFHWDKQKAKRNQRKHGVSLEEASTVFYDSLSATFDDEDHSEDEARLITVGFSSRGHLLFVSHVEKENSVIRIISARKATAHERKKHEGS